MSNTPSELAAALTPPTIAPGIWLSTRSSPYWPIVQNYLVRLRFWVLAVLYALTLSSSLQWRFAPELIAFFVFVNCLIASFLALHLRRQVTGPAAHLVPGYAAPHLIVSALVTLTIWGLIPGA